MSGGIFANEIDCDKGQTGFYGVEVDRILRTVKEFTVKICQGHFLTSLLSASEIAIF